MSLVGISILWYQLFFLEYLNSYHADKYAAKTNKILLQNIWFFDVFFPDFHDGIILEVLLSSNTDILILTRIVYNIPTLNCNISTRFLRYFQL